jgi:hypothetical protein
MPYGMCPICGQTMHISVSEVKEWYGQYYPGIPAGSLVPAKCFFCWQELKSGDTVVIRKAFADLANAHVGEVGVIRDILTLKGDGSLFLIQLSSGKEVYCIRAQLRKLREGEVQSTRTTE